MIVKPAQAEADSRWVELADRVGEGRRSVERGAEQGRRALRKAARWYLVAIFGFGLMGAAAASGPVGLLLILLVGGGLWWWRRR